MQNERNFKKRIETIHAKGMKAITYVALGFADDTMPEFKLFGAEWRRTPGISQRYSGNRGCFSVCPGSAAWADFIIYNIKEAVEKYDLDGIYYDVSTSAFCDNHHHSCGRKIGDKPVVTWNAFAIRELQKRIYIMLKSMNKETVIFEHVSASGPTPFIFCDLFTDGEGYRGWKDYTNLTLDQFKAAMYGRQWGDPHQFLVVLQRDFAFSHHQEQADQAFKNALAVCLLHDVLPLSFGRTDWPIISPYWRLFDQYRLDEAKWLPYWETSSIISAPDQVKTSIYKFPDRAVLVMATQNLNKENFMIKINPDKLGFHPVRAMNLANNENIQLEDYKINLTVSGSEPTLILILGPEQQ